MAADPRTGKVLQGRYKIAEPLAEGGMGVVYRAERVGIGRPVVVKFLHTVLTDTPGIVDRFEREASSSAERLMSGDAPTPTPAPVTAAREVAEDDTVQRGIAIENVAGDEEEPEEDEGAGLIGQRETDEDEEEEPSLG